MTGLVIDASVALSWCFEDEVHSHAESALETMRARQAFAPGLWALEVANALLSSRRRGRLSAKHMRANLAFLCELGVQLEHTPDERVLGRILGLAEQHELSVYDAAYLELALRRGLRLCTIDKKLGSAARARGVFFELPRGG